MLVGVWTTDNYCTDVNIDYHSKTCLYLLKICIYNDVYTHIYIICTRSAYMSQMYTAGLSSSFPDLLYSKHANTNGLSHQPVAKCVRIAVPINNTRRKTCPNHWVYNGIQACYITTCDQTVG